jgi:hypothetical protein
MSRLPVLEFCSTGSVMTRSMEIVCKKQKQMYLEGVVNVVWNDSSLH